MVSAGPKDDVPPLVRLGLPELRIACCPWNCKWFVCAVICCYWCWVTLRELFKMPWFCNGCWFGDWAPKRELAAEALLFAPERSGGGCY